MAAAIQNRWELICRDAQGVVTDAGFRNAWRYVGADLIKLRRDPLAVDLAVYVVRRCNIILLAMGQSYPGTTNTTLTDNICSDATNCPTPDSSNSNFSLSVNFQ